jgi:hypothetical protein
VNKSYNQSNFVMGYLDVIPAVVFIVDEDVRLLNYNRSAGETFGLEKSAVLHRRGGEVLHCIHSTDHPDGCGRGPFCVDCIIRKAVNTAAEGKQTARIYTQLSLIGENETLSLDCVVTSAPIIYNDENRVLLVVEDISELARLRKLLPICSWCRKIRDDAGYWESVERYLSEKMSVNFTHGICPECVANLDGEIVEVIASAEGNSKERGN